MKLGRLLPLPVSLECPQAINDRRSNRHNRMATGCSTEGRRQFDDKIRVEVEEDLQQGQADAGGCGCDFEVVDGRGITNLWLFSIFWILSLIYPFL